MMPNRSRLKHDVSSPFICFVCWPEEAIWFSALNSQSRQLWYSFLWVWFQLGQHCLLWQRVSKIFVSTHPCVPLGYHYFKITKAIFRNQTKSDLVLVKCHRILNLHQPLKKSQKCFVELDSLTEWGLVKEKSLVTHWGSKLSKNSKMSLTTDRSDTASPCCYCFQILGVFKFLRWCFQLFAKTGQANLNRIEP